MRVGSQPTTEGGRDGVEGGRAGGQFRASQVSTAHR